MPRRINAAGLALLKEFEGCRLDAYRDASPARIWTCGWGATGDDVGPGVCWTQAQADERLMLDLRHFETLVDAFAPKTLSSNQYSALICFAYNVGVSALRGSSLMRKIAAGDIQGAGDEFLRWNRAGMRVLPGLTRRRQAERTLFLTPD